MENNKKAKLKMLIVFLMHMSVCVHLAYKLCTRQIGHSVSLMASDCREASGSTIMLWKFFYFSQTKKTFQWPIFFVKLAWASTYITKFQ